MQLWFCNLCGRFYLDSYLNNKKSYIAFIKERLLLSRTII
jgi:hypothetical protein